MACKITISLLSENQTGTIGNDWKYSLEAKIFNTGVSHAPAGKGTISVPKHRLDSGKTQVPPGPPEALVLPAGEAGAEILVDLRIKAAEVDLFQNDTAETTTSFKMTCPAAGDAAVVEEREVSLGVQEEPSGIGHAVFKLAYRVTLESD
jgi:hypothetical protein